MESKLDQRKDGKQNRSKETIGVIVESARRLFKKGAKASTNHIAEFAGVSIGTLYQYFPNKESIQKTSIENEMEELITDISNKFLNVSQEADTLEAALTEMLESFLKTYIKQKNIFKFFYFRAANLKILGPIVRAELVGSKMIAKILEEKGGYSKSESEVKSYFIAQTCLWMVRSGWMHDKDLDEEVLLKELKLMIFGYLEKSLPAGQSKDLNS